MDYSDEEENPRIVEIDLKNQDLTILDRGIFRHYAHANRILLTGNKISEIDENAFDNIENLTSLYLNNNRLLKIDEAIRRQENLKVLHLKSNRIRKIEANTFDNLERLRILRLSNNNLASVSPLCLLPLRHLTHLSLSNTNIGPLAPPFFNANLHLRQLFLDNCCLEIGSGLFRCLRKLESLDLSGNSLTELEPGIFRGLRALRFLKIENNLLHSLPDDLLADCEQLLLINLSENNLENLSGDFFVNNHLLQTIDLYACSSRLNARGEIFRESPLIDSLSIGTCERMPIRSLTGLKNLFIEPSSTDNSNPLDIKTNLIRLLNNVPKGITMLQLRKCRLQREHLDAIVNNFQRIKVLTLYEVTFDNENSACLTDNLFLISLFLEKISISKSPLNNFNVRLFGRHNSVTQLVLNECKLFTLEARYFKNLEALEELVLDNNYFVSTLNSDVFIHLENLRELRMINCQITQLPNALFERNLRLESINFEHNPIGRINIDSILPNCDRYQQLSKLSIWEATAIDGTIPARLVIERVPHKYS